MLRVGERRNVRAWREEGRASYLTRGLGKPQTRSEASA